MDPRKLKEAARRLRRAARLVEGAALGVELNVTSQVHVQVVTTQRAVEDVAHAARIARLALADLEQKDGTPGGSTS